MYKHIHAIYNFSVTMAHFLNISVVYILRKRKKNYLFFKLCIKKTKRIKRRETNKAFILTPYQNMLIFFTFEDNKNGLCFNSLSKCVNFLHILKTKKWSVS